MVSLPRLEPPPSPPSASWALLDQEEGTPPGLATNADPVCVPSSQGSSPHAVIRSRPTRPVRDPERSPLRGPASLIGTNDHERWPRGPRPFAPPSRNLPDQTLPRRSDRRRRSSAGMRLLAEGSRNLSRDGRERRSCHPGAPLFPETSSGTRVRARRTPRFCRPARRSGSFEAYPPSPENTCGKQDAQIGLPSPSRESWVHVSANDVGSSAIRLAEA